MQNLKENKEIKKYRDDFGSTSEHIRSLGENLMYASLYNERVSFQENLDELVRKWWHIYNLDRILEALTKDEE